MESVTDHNLARAAVSRYGGGVRRAAARFCADETGAVYVELIFATLLLVGFMVFLTIFGRAFTERSRMLAANRTVAWLYAHTDPKESGWLSGVLGSGEQPAAFEKLVSSGRLAELIAEWHFRTAGAGAGFVEITHSSGDNLGNGIFAKGDDRFDFLAAQAASETADNATSEDGETFESLEFQSEENEPLGAYKIEGGDSGSYRDKVKGENGALAQLMVGFADFLTRDFRYYRAQVAYAMPLLFPRRALEFFFGELAVREVASAGRPAGAGAKVYAFIKPDWSGGCVMPVLECGSGGGTLTGLRDAIDDTMDSAQALEGQLDRYRPNYYPGDNAGENAVYFGSLSDQGAGDGGQSARGLTEAEIEKLTRATRALLVFEKDYPGLEKAGGPYLTPRPGYGLPDS